MKDTSTTILKSRLARTSSLMAINASHVANTVLGMAERKAAAEVGPKPKKRVKYGPRSARPSRGGAVIKHGHCGKYLEVEITPNVGSRGFRVRALHATKGWRTLPHVPPGWAVDPASIKVPEIAV